MSSPTVGHTTGAILRPTLWLGALLSIAVGALSYLGTLTLVENDAGTRFKIMTRTAQHKIEIRIKSYTNLLRASASVFKVSNDIGREQFHDFVTGLALDKNFPAIETINFARVISGEERDAFEARMRDGDLLVKGGHSGFSIVPPGRRPSYSVLIYVEPNPYWSHTVGRDIEAVPAVARVLREARDSGLLTTSGTPIAAMTSRNRVGLGMRLPVYRANAPTGTVEQRRAAYIGSVGIAFSVEKLMHGILAEMPIRNVRMVLSNYTKTGPDGTRTEQLLHDSSATATNPRPALNNDPGRFDVDLPVDFNGREWSVRFSVAKSELFYSSDGYFPLLAMVAGAVSTMLLYALFYTLSSSRRRAIEMANGMTRELRDSQAKLQLSNENLRRLAAHAEHIKEGERKRIAREIHDDLGQNLLALRIEADMLCSRTGQRQPRLHERARSTLLQIDTTIKSVRQIINDLRPTVLDLGLNAAVGWQIAEFRRRTGIDCELVENHDDIQVSDRCATALFRILQESLSNISRHAQASRVRVALHVEKDWITMTVSDNGIGLHPNVRHKPGSFGLVGVEERVNILHGSFAITSSAASGTVVKVTVPARDGEVPSASAHRSANAREPGDALV
jgi:signal transduction histidine kinase/CHASE1-domain containing sensor protein